MELHDLIDMDSNLKIIKRSSYTSETKYTKNQILLKIRNLVKQEISKNVPDHKIIPRIDDYLKRFVIDDFGLNDKVDIFMRDKLKLVNQKVNTNEN